MHVPSWRKAEPLQSPGRTLLCGARVQEEVGIPDPGGPGEEEELGSVLMRLGDLGTCGPDRGYRNEVPDPVGFPQLECRSEQGFLVMPDLESRLKSCLSCRAGEPALHYD